MLKFEADVENFTILQMLISNKTGVMVTYILLNIVFPFLVGCIIGGAVSLSIIAIQKKIERKRFSERYFSLLNLLKELRELEPMCVNVGARERVQYATKRVTRQFHLLVQGETTINEGECGDGMIEINVKNGQVY